MDHPKEILRIEAKILERLQAENKNYDQRVELDAPKFYDFVYDTDLQK